MPRTPFATLLALLMAAPTAQAQEIDCATAMTQLDLNQCAYQDWQAQDAVLNSAYKTALRMLTSWDADLPEDERGAAKALKEGQRAWITFRDKACEAEGYAMHGGSAGPLLVYGCMARLTEDRSQDLTQMVENYGG